MRHVKEDHWGRALCFFLNQQKRARGPQSEDSLRRSRCPREDVYAAAEVVDARRVEARLVPQTRAALSNQERARVHPLQEHLGGRRPREDVHAAVDFAGFASASTPCVSVTKT